MLKKRKKTFVYKHHENLSEGERLRTITFSRSFSQRLSRPKGLICVAAAQMLNFAVAGNRTQVAVLTAVSPLPLELDVPPPNSLYFSSKSAPISVFKSATQLHFSFTTVALPVQLHIVLHDWYINTLRKYGVNQAEEVCIKVFTHRSNPRIPSIGRIAVVCTGPDLDLHQLQSSSHHQPASAMLLQIKLSHNQANHSGIVSKSPNPSDQMVLRALLSQLTKNDKEPHSYGEGKLIEPINRNWHPTPQCLEPLITYPLCPGIEINRLFCGLHKCTVKLSGDQQRSNCRQGRTQLHGYWSRLLFQRCNCVPLQSPKNGKSSSNN
ncbi:hypothetical protein YC2023_012797 [Brassica napus]